MSYLEFTVLIYLIISYKLRVLIHYGESEKNLIFEMNSEHCPKIKDIHYPRGKSLVEIINS